MSKRASSTTTVKETNSTPPTESEIKSLAKRFDRDTLYKLFRALDREGKSQVIESARKDRNYVIHGGGK